MRENSGEGECDRGRVKWEERGVKGEGEGMG